MNKNASVLTIRIPHDLKHRIEKVADQQGVSINQLALYVFSKEIQDLETSQYFSNYIQNKSKRDILNDFDSVMLKIGNKKVPAWDKM